MKSIRAWLLWALLVAPLLRARLEMAAQPELFVTGATTASPHSLEAQADPLQSLGGGGRTRLKLCDCEPAKGDPGGLSCAKEGFFVSSFERQGQWVAGGGAVPLSRAICCRPCLPESLPPSASGHGVQGQRPVAVVSLGCHASSDGLGLRCEAQSGSFVTGFTDAVHVFGSVDAYYPVDTAQCCTPSLLLDNGDAWDLERCDCEYSKDAEFPINCANATALLEGFDDFRLSPMGQVVPIGPAKCCSVCLSESVHPINDCSDLGRCSNHGVCLLGRCECLAGWGGPDCSLPLGGRGGGGGVPPWAIALIVIGSCVLAMGLIGIAAHVAQALSEMDSGSDDEGEAGRPLLLRIEADDCGSVGSTDTESGDELEAVEERIEGVISHLEGRLAAEPHAGDGPAAVAAFRADDDLPGTEAPAAAGEPSPVAAAVGSAAAVEVTQAPVAPQARAPPAAPAAHPSPAEEEAAPVAAEEAGQAEQQPSADGVAAATTAVALKKVAAPCTGSCAGIGPLSDVDCSVCMIRPVQAVIIPCGHVCVCRRCSRRLTRCPICRKEIVRRQRLFV